MRLMRTETKIKLLGCITIALTGITALTISVKSFAIWLIALPFASYFGWKAGKRWGGEE